MIPVAIALVGGAAVAAGEYTRRKIKKIGGLRVFAGDMRDVAAQAGAIVRELPETELGDQKFHP